MAHPFRWDGGSQLARGTNAARFADIISDVRSTVSSSLLCRLFALTGSKFTNRSLGGVSGFDHLPFLFLIGSRGTAEANS